MRFWKYTPFELNLLVEKYIASEKEKAQNITTLAWYTEAFARQKKLPKLEDLFKETKEKKAMTDSDMLEEIKRLNLQMGGEVY